MKKLLPIALLASLCLALLAVPAAAAERSEIVVRDPMLDAYPRVRFELVLPSNLLDSSTQPKFSVQENGRTVDVLEASQPKTDPIDVVLLLDTSGSMKGASMDAAKQAADAFIDELQPGSRAALIGFSDRPRVLAQLSEDRSELKSAIDGLDAGGETAVYDALSLGAAETSRAKVRRPVIVLLSDGGDTASRVRLDAATRQLKAASAPVLVVALPSAEADFQTLRSVARQTGGRFATVRGAGDLLAFYRGLARELQTSWTLTYASVRPTTKDLDVTVKATVSGREAEGSVILPNPLYAGDTGTSTTLKPVPPANVITLAIASVLVFGAVAALITALGMLLVKPKTALDHMRYYDQLHAEGGGEDQDTYSGRLTTSLMDAVDFVAGKRGLRRYVYDQLERAGLPLRPTEYITLHLLGVCAVGVLLEAVSRNLVVSLLGVCVVTMAPIGYVEYRIKKRTAAFRDQLPDVLTLIAGSLRAGWGLQQAVDMVVEQMPEPTCIEFRRAQTEIRLGRTVESALEAIANRMQSDDFAWAVTAIGIQRDVGGNLAEVLDVVALTIRDRAALKRQIDSLTAEGRLSAWVLILLPFVMIVALFLLNPTYMSQLTTSLPGLVMLAFGALLLVIGIVWLRRTVAIEV